MNADYTLLVGKDLKFLPQQQMDDYKCTICKKVAIDCQSSSCGCIFCKHCIRDYLCNGDKRCPGNMEFCSDLSLTLDIEGNTVLKRRIGKLDVYCVFGCGKTMKFDALLEHIRVCDLGIADCPYKSIGCETQNIRKKELTDHMTRGSLNHAELFVNWVVMVNDKFTNLEIGLSDEAGDAKFQKNPSSMADRINELQNNIENRTNTMHAWTIPGYKNHFEKGRGNSEYYVESDPIYLGGYCFLVRFYPYYFFQANECYYVSLKYAIIRGNYDDKLKWPCTKNVHLSVLKPRDDSNYNTKSTSAKINKPTSGPHQFSDHFGLAHCKFVNDISKELQVNDAVKFTIAID